MTLLRSYGRQAHEMRPLLVEDAKHAHADGSCLVAFGQTKVLCLATIEEKVPPHIRNTGKGWVTAEYGMLPRATHSRSDRVRNAESGRTKEISRLIGRSLRSIVHLAALGERQIIIDCDVLQADGGTRTAAITGGYVALAMAVRRWQKKGLIKSNPLMDEVAAISCGVVKGKVCCDLDYEEDSQADVDGNFIITGRGGLVEIQACGEQGPFEESQLHQMIEQAKAATKQLCQTQRALLDEVKFS